MALADGADAGVLLGDGPAASMRRAGRPLAQEAAGAGVSDAEAADDAAELAGLAELEGSAVVDASPDADADAPPPFDCATTSA